MPEVETSLLRRRAPARGPDASLSQEAEQQLVLYRQGRKTLGYLIRAILLVLTLITTVIAVMPWSFLQQDNIDPLNYATRTRRLLSRTPLIDGHNDLPYLIRLQLNNKIYNARFPFAFKLASHTDLPRMKQGQVGGQFWSVYISCPKVTHLDDPSHSVRDTLEQIDVAKRLIADYPDLQYCETSSCARKAFKRKRISSMLGAEGLHQVGSSIAVIRQLYELGVRYITLTHNCDNAFATAASTVTETGKDSGLSELGKFAVAEMNRLGMMVDLSHTSHRTMRDVLDSTLAPVIFSHSACYSIAKNMRNAPDDVLRRLPENGGVIMIYFVGKFLRPDDPEAATLEDAVDHISHAVSLAGWDHVGIGSDFDGTSDIVRGIDDVSGYPRLIEAVMRRGATDEQVRKLVGENVLRVWRENELLASSLQKQKLTRPAEHIWEGRALDPPDGSLPLLHQAHRRA